jgi:HD-GYP domain-containing protein (c-di-GMP phosphodiesterase class II)
MSDERNAENPSVDALFGGIDITRIDERVTRLVDALKVARKSGDRRKYYEAIAMMSRAIEEKDDYTARHTERVTLYALVIFDMLTQQAAFKKVDNEQTRQAVKVAALLHDVGKILIRDEVLKKPGHLTNDEFDEIKAHSGAGFEVACCAEETSEILDGIRFHHERPDGKGYPEGLKGEQIPFVAAVIAVADAYDAMTSDRPYRKALSKEVAAEEIAKGRGTQFVPYAADAFAKAHGMGLI